MRVHRDDNRAIQAGLLKRGERGDELRLYNGRWDPVHLRDFYKGQTVFLLCAGPSLAQVDFEQLRRPGIVTMGLNNTLTMFRPNLWVCIDPPSRFIDTGWKDPTILKFAPAARHGARLGVQGSDGRVAQSEFTAGQMPSVLFYPREDGFDHAGFLDSAAVQWGCTDKTRDSLGIEASRSVMLAAFRLIYHLGFARVCLLGCDFRMEPGFLYAFDETRAPNAINNNQRMYAAMRKRFSALAPLFEERGLDVVNCTPGSALEAFRFLDFQDAIDAAAEDFEREISSRGWYEPQTPKSLAERRAEERAKYAWLKTEVPDYGSSNHGAEALELVLSYQPDLVADLGCGRNQFVQGLRQHGCRGVGVDWVYPEADRNAEMHATGLETASVDVVTAFDSLEHLIPEDVPLVLKEMKRIARPGAHFVFSIATRPSRILVHGENLHPTVQDTGWWVDQINRVGSVSDSDYLGRYICGRFASDSEAVAA